MKSLAAVFAQSAPPEVLARLGLPAQIEAALRALVAQARGVWPDIDLPDAVFVEHLAKRLGLDGRLESIHCADLFLACACSSGDARAIEDLDRAFLAGLPAALGRSNRRLASADDVRQLVRQKLLVRAGGSPPRIADYSGRGPLSHWIRAVAVRTAQDLARTRKEEVTSPDEALAGLPSPALDPEMACIKEHFGSAFKAAFEEAMASLDQRGRSLLRLHFLEGLTPDEIGSIYHVHRTTVWRWISKCREDLFERTRRLLAERLSVGQTEFESLMCAVRSQLDVSISRLLK